MPTINAERLLDDLATLRTYGATGNGVVRPSLSPVDLESRTWLEERMRDAGLEAVTDGVGNVLGRSRNSGPALLMGSHSDTQPRGGWLDGAMGVIYALEVARALSEDAATAHLAVDAVSLMDEESTFLGCLGSLSMCGDLDASQEAAARNADGVALRDALVAAGYASRPRARIEPDRHIGYLEAHIEQGPHLEDTGKRVGVVTSIVGIRACRVLFHGEQNHAGTTPMARRKDAGVALFEFATRLRPIFQGLAGDATVWTFGKAVLDPGTQSIIPGFAELTVQFRDPDEPRLEAMMNALRGLAETMTGEGPVPVTVEDHRYAVVPTQMDEGFQQHLATAAERHAPDGWVRMPSAAGHDAMVIAHHLPCAMLFIPSIDGISHDFAEDSRHDDIALGCQVFADAAAAILLEAHRSA